jgi:hypothetical protein
MSCMVIALPSKKYKQVIIRLYYIFIDNIAIILYNIDMIKYLSKVAGRALVTIHIMRELQFERKVSRRETRDFKR